MTKHLNYETFVGHVHLVVSNLERSVAFYRDLIGLRVYKEEGQKAFLTTDNEHTLIVLEELEGAVRKPRRSTGLYHFAILVPNRVSLALSLRHLLEKSYPVEGASDHLFSEAMYLSDPDGNGIEIYSDRPMDKWERQLNGELKAPSDPLDIEGLLAEGEGLSFSGLPSTTRIGHVHLHVANLTDAERFYVEGLGLDVMIRMQGHALFVSTDGYHHHLGLNTWAGEGAPQPPTHAVGLKQYSLQFADQSELDEVVARLRQMDAPLQGGDAAVIATDPFGNKVELKIL
ncbi:VOC family protein [Bacillus fonticola]|uniref:VOC family protein n=1 Tax=Bacillus fonticola TaxID=2728853 RepID=UPI001475BFF1|nr:VOC family protein [Bacillus fonticola]